MTQGLRPLRATVWGSLLERYVDINVHRYDVRRKDLTLALPVNGLEAMRLARYGMVAGYVSGGVLRNLILKVPKSVVVRVLKADPPRAGEISRPKLPPQHTFPSQIDTRYLKLGRMGSAYSTCWMLTS
jgi:hypothetical protein